DNLQTRMLCGIESPYDELPASALDDAKRNLRERLAWVGTTERFTEFLALLNLELGWPTLAPRRARANPRRPRGDELRPLAERYNELDRGLYAYAAELLEDALARRGPELADEVEVLRRAGENASTDAR